MVRHPSTAGVSAQAGSEIPAFAGMTEIQEQRMLGWFGRKSAPERRPFVPAWLQGEGDAGGFVRGFEHMA